MEPKTWTDKEIIDLMLKEIREYKLEQVHAQQPIEYEEMMECVLSILKEYGLIEHTP